MNRRVRLGDTTVSPRQLARIAPHFPLVRRPVFRRSTLTVECWLYTARLAGGTALLIGGMYDQGQFEDAWMYGSVPSNSDYWAIGAYLLRDRKVQLGALWFPYRFMQSISVAPGALIYLLRADGASSRSIDALRVAGCSADTISPELQELQIRGIDLQGEAIRELGGKLIRMLNPEVGLLVVLSSGAFGVPTDIVKWLRDSIQITDPPEQKPAR